MVRALTVLFLISSSTFFMLRSMPGGPFDEESSQSLRTGENLSAHYGLDKPLGHQYFLYMSHLLRGDMGQSLVHRDQGVADMIFQGLSVSFVLGGGALLIVLLLGSLLGGLTGFSPQSPLGKGLYRWATLSICVPSFVSAPLFIIFFSLGWPWTSLWPEWKSWGGWLPAGLWLGPRYAILPILALSYRPTAFLTRLIRSSVMEVSQSAYVRTARAKGAKPSWIFFDHVLQNALSPALTYVGPLSAGLLTGSFVVEVAFAIPGMANIFVQSVFERDYPLVLGATLVFSAFLIFSHLVIDLIRDRVFHQAAHESS